MKAILSLWLVVVLAAAGAVRAADAPPNFVFIMADDLGWADVAFHGGNAPTPHLDRLAAEGLELTAHYVAPVCSPTRAGLLTGRFWSRFGVTTPQNELALPPQTVTLARALQSTGYATCLTGKWHLGSLPKWGPNHFGFDHSYGSLAGGVAPWNHFYKKGHYSRTWHRNEQLLEEPGHVTDLIAQEAVGWIEQQRDQPFFLYVPFTAVHLPVKEPQAWLDRVPVAIQGDVPRHYAACIMHLDDAVGQIVAALERAGKRDNTLVVFTSDNGGSTAENNDTKYPEDDHPNGRLPGDNTPLRGRKGDLYEGGIRVPTIASWPTRLKPGRCDVPLHIVDWTPTLCALAGYQPSADLKWDGQDVWPILSAGAPAPQRMLYWTAPGFRATAVRAGDWKLIESGRAEGQQVELFNVTADRSETKNLADEMPEKVRQLQAQRRAIAAADRDAVAPR